MRSGDITGVAGVTGVDLVLHRNYYKTIYKKKGEYFLSILFLSQKNKAHKISNKIPKIPDKNTHIL